MYMCCLIHCLHARWKLNLISFFSSVLPNRKYNSAVILSNGEGLFNILIDLLAGTAKNNKKWPSDFHGHLPALLQHMTSGLVSTPLSLTKLVAGKANN